ncbi:hypothetical protein BSYN_13320 [Bacteroides sedimenti]|uniref:Uncharacterized protein n=1 Tax=Bacteroides sedimenti TaxID=2136147 RepID=A0ABN6Z3B9_9BACE
MLLCSSLQIGLFLIKQVLLNRETHKAKIVKLTHALSLGHYLGILATPITIKYYLKPKMKMKDKKAYKESLIYSSCYVGFATIALFSMYPDSFYRTKF